MGWFQNFGPSEQGGGGDTLTRHDVTADGGDEYTLDSVPDALRIYSSGLLMREGAENDYTVSGDVVTFLNVPASGTNLTFFY